MTAQPNFLFLITDQQRADYLGCYGHPILQTPNIDAIAARGCRFENFHVASPVCMPNRASLMTGCYPSAHGLRRNGIHLSTDRRTFADVLRAGGYTTALIGKSHLQPFSAGMAPENPFRKHPVPEALDLSDQISHQELPESWRRDQFDLETPFYGFDHVELVTMHGDRCGGHYYRWLRHKLGCDPDDIRGPDNQLAHNYACPQAVRTALPEELTSTGYVRERTIDFLRDPSRGESPFFAFVSFPDPHHPFTPPGRYWDMYDPDDFSIDLPYKAHRNPLPHLAGVREKYDRGERITEGQKSFMVNDQEIREAMALTCGMITCIDDAIGEIIAALDDSGLSENTVVVFNSDHGDYMGDFNLLLKGPLPTRALTRVPFIWADPKKAANKVVEGLASTVDVAATIIDRCDLLPYNGMQGSSLLPMMRGDDSGHERLYIEHEDNKPVWDLDEAAESRTIVDHHHRLTVYKNQTWGELYSFDTDPLETHNLWESREHTELRADLTEQLLRMMFAATETSPRPERLG